MLWEATHLQSNRYVVRPVGQLGTCGFYPAPWTAFFTSARNEAEAMSKFYRAVRAKRFRVETR